MNTSDNRIGFEGNSFVCDCKDYDIVSYIRSSAKTPNWLDGVNCAAPPELANEKVCASPGKGIAN